MATRTVVEDNTKPDTATPPYLRRLLPLLISVAALALLAIGIWLRLRQLGLPFDRDSYDEGVYWQTLRAMSAGYPLYQQTFYSQPPFFLLSIFPTYLLFGSTIWSARLGIALISVLGLLGALLLGKALRGRIGAIAALLLLVVDPLYLRESQTLQAEAPSVALSLLAVGLAYLWWERPESLSGLVLAILCAITLALGIYSKLLVVTALVPVGLLMLAHLWRIYRRPLSTWRNRISGSRSILWAMVAFLLVTLLLFLPFLGSFYALWQGMVTFHTAAGETLKSQHAGNRPLIMTALLTLSGFAALYGTLAALLRRDWRVLPLLAWLLVTLFLLWRQVPLFAHHLVALGPPLIALAVMGIGPLQLKRKHLLTLANAATAFALVLILLVTATNAQVTRNYFSVQRAKSAIASSTDTRVVQDLRQATQPGQLVVTDAQFIAALADRNTPPSLVDTSTVRIDTRYLTAQQLIDESSRSQVQAVLFYTGRLKNVPVFHSWVAQHFKLARNYGGGKELWVKI